MTEFKIITRHAATVLAGQLATMAFGVTDTIVAGRHSSEALAALSIGSAIFVSVYVALMGVMQALMPVWAELHGAKRMPDVGRSVRQALYLSAATMLLGMAVLMFPGALMRWTDVPQTVQADVENYLSVLAWALPAALLFRIFSTLSQSLGYPRLVTWLQLGSLLVKVPLTLWFALGGWGLEPQGATGCAWATLVVNYTLLGLAIWLLRTQALYRPYRIWQRMERPDRIQLMAFARLGIPAGLAIMVEVTSFTLMALFIARQGTAASASHQIASNLAAVLYMVPLSIAIATSARVSYWLGAAQPAHARAVVGMGLRLAACMALLLSASLFVLRTPLAAAYTTHPDVIAGASVLLGWVACFHLADAMQAMGIFVLRCYRITIAPLLTYCVILWGVGLGGGALLAYRGLGPWGPLHTPSAFWIMGSAALGITAAVILWLLRRTLRQSSQQALV